MEVSASTISQNVWTVPWWKRHSDPRTPPPFKHAARTPSPKPPSRFHHQPLDGKLSAPRTVHGSAPSTLHFPSHTNALASTRRLSLYHRILGRSNLTQTEDSMDPSLQCQRSAFRQISQMPFFLIHLVFGNFQWISDQWISRVSQCLTAWELSYLTN